MPDVITCISEGDDPSGRRRPGVNRSDDAPARPAQGCEPGATARATRPLVATGKPVCEPHDFTGEPGAGNRHAGFGERGEETCPRGPDCGPVRKRRISHRPPTGYAPPLDSTSASRHSARRGQIAPPSAMRRRSGRGVWSSRGGGRSRRRGRSRGDSAAQRARIGLTDRAARAPSALLQAEATVTEEPAAGRRVRTINERMTRRTTERQENGRRKAGSRAAFGGRR